MTSRVWNDLEQVASILREVFDDLGQVGPLNRVGSGSSSEVFETPSGELFRLGRSEAATATYEWEAWLLPQLRSRLSFSIPDPQWHSGPSSSYPFGIMGYRRLPGEPLSGKIIQEVDSCQIACDIARFMRQLHSCKIERPEGIPVPDYHADPDALEATRTTVLPCLKMVLSHEEFEVASNWIHSLIHDRVMREYEPVLIHGDLFYGNILIDKSTSCIIGVVDFGDACFGDPAQDVAVQYHLGSGFAECVMEKYEASGGHVDDAFKYRVRQLWILREFSGMKYFIDTGDVFEFACSVAKLRHGPLFSKEGG